jgi:peptidoglycan/LPS O-acetylase OafA/YrhL
MRFFYWLGELSYGAYLIHLLVLTPVAAWLITSGSPAKRFGLALVITIVVTYALAALGRLVIEMPGQRLGKRLVTPPSPHARSTASADR